MAVGRGQRCCCGPSCDVCADKFGGADPLSDNWEGDTGDFTKSGGELTSTATNKSIACKTEASGSDHYASADVKGSNAGDQAIVIVAWTDNDNYLYGFVNFGNFGVLRIYKVVSGTHTQLATTSTITISTATFHQLEVCYSEDGASSTLHATLTLDSGTRHTVRDETVGSFTGKQAGLGVRSTPGTVTFDNFDFDRLDTPEETGSCPMCPGVNCDRCTNDATPPALKVTIYDLENNCGADGCDDFEGTFILPQDDLNVCTYDQSCLNCAACEGSAHRTVSAGFVKVGADYILRVTLHINLHGTSTITFEKNYGTSKIPCQGLTNTRVDWKSNTGTAPTAHCYGDANSYAEVTSLP